MKRSVFDRHRPIRSEAVYEMLSFLILMIFKSYGISVGIRRSVGLRQRFKFGLCRICLCGLRLLILMIYFRRYKGGELLDLPLVCSENWSLFSCVLFSSKYVIAAFIDNNHAKFKNVIPLLTSAAQVTITGTFRNLTTPMVRCR